MLLPLSTLAHKGPLQLDMGVCRYVPFAFCSRHWLHVFRGFGARKRWLVSMAPIAAYDRLMAPYLIAMIRQTNTKSLRHLRLAEDSMCLLSTWFLGRHEGSL